MNDVAVMDMTCAKRVKAVEQIALTLQSEGLRKVAFASIESDTATADVASDVAEALARSGRRTLLVDLSGARIGPRWQPGGGSITPEADADGRRFDTISATDGQAARAAYNNPKRLARELDEQFKDYDVVLLHVDGLMQDSGGQINAVAVAAAADGIILVCPTGEVRTATIRSAMQDVVAAGGKVVGTVMDDRSNHNVGTDVARVTRRVLGFFPALAQWAGARVANSSILRTPLYS